MAKVQRIGQAWPALLAQVQANRDQAQANRDIPAQAQANGDHALANREQAQANHVTPRALLQAMQAQHDPCACELHSAELQCWKSGAQGAVDVARRATNAAEPDGYCWPSALTSDIGTPPATPSSRRVAAAAGREALDKPFKRRLFA